MVYNEENIKLFYISKYVDIKINDKDIVLYNYIYRTGIEMKNAADIIEFMGKGVNEKEMLEYLKRKGEEQKAQEILEELIRCGVIE